MGEKTPPISVNTETGSHKYGNGQNKVDNKTRFFYPFSTLPSGHAKSDPES
jgi:hypothetical protein